MHFVRSGKSAGLMVGLTLACLEKVRVGKSDVAPLFLLVTLVNDP